MIHQVSLIGLFYLEISSFEKDGTHSGFRILKSLFLAKSLWIEKEVCSSVKSIIRESYISTAGEMSIIAAYSFDIDLPNFCRIQNHTNVMNVISVLCNFLRSPLAAHVILPIFNEIALNVNNTAFQSAFKFLQTSSVHIVELLIMISMLYLEKRNMLPGHSISL